MTGHPDTQWHRNTGSRPRPASADEPPAERVFVRLRSGHEPAASWPVDTGRRETTRWSLTDHPSDIIEWKRA